jgi:hypothetical protein
MKGRDLDHAPKNTSNCTHFVNPNRRPFTPISSTNHRQGQGGATRALCPLRAARVDGPTSVPFPAVRASADDVMERLKATVQVVKRNELHTFVVLPKRWIVERSFGWLEKCRRLWKNCERTGKHCTILARHEYRAAGLPKNSTRGRMAHKRQYTVRCIPDWEPSRCRPEL